MKTRNIIAILLLLCVCITMFAGCKNDDKTPETSTPSVETPDDTSKPSDTEKTKQELCKEALAEIKTYVLNVDVVNYKDSYINGYGAYSEDYEKATVITIGITFPEGAYSKYWERITISGDTATGKDGNPAPQTLSSAGWISDDRNYAILICRVAGEVDASKVDVILKSKVDGISRESKFENNGEEIGFDDAKSKFVKSNDFFGVGNFIVELKGRHYFIVRRYCSSTGSTSSDAGSFSTRKESFVLIPLEGGLLPSLTEDDVNLVCEKEIPNTTVKLIVNKSGQVDKSSLDSQTTIEVEAWRERVEAPLEDGSYSKEVYDLIQQNQEEIIESCYVEIDDGNGNIIKLYFK